MALSWDVLSRLPEKRRSQVRQAVRTAVAAVLAYGIATAFALPQGVWAVITAVIVVQNTLGATLGMTIDRLLGTVLGAALGLVCVLLVGPSPWLVGAALFGIVALAVFIAVDRPSLRLASITAAIVLLSNPTDGHPVLSAADRIGEILLGAVIGIAASLLVFPVRAGGTLTRRLAAVLPLCGELLQQAVDGLLGTGADPSSSVPLHARIRAELRAGDALAGEARRELSGHLADHADPAPLLRAVRRFWHTQFLVLRAAREPLSAALQERLAAPLRGMAAAVRGHLDLLVRRIVSGEPPPAATEVTAALAALTGAIVALRQEPCFQALPIDDMARIFALSFAFDQMVGNLEDLAERSADLAAPR